MSAPSGAARRAALACGGACAALTVAAFVVPAVARLDGRWLVETRIALAPVVSVEAAAQITRIGQPAKFLVLTAGVCLVGVAAAGWRSALRVGLVVTGATVTTQLLQELLRRPRDLGLGLDRVSEYPSGHMTGLASLAIACTLLAPARHRTLVASIGVGASAVMAAALAVTDSHMPSDVAAAVLVAAAWGFAVGAPLARRDVRWTATAVGAAVAVGLAAVAALVALGGVGAARTIAESVRAAPGRSALALAIVVVASPMVAVALRRAARAALGPG